MNVEATHRTLDRLGIDPTTDAMAALALTLAQALDEGATGQLANVAREHRQAIDRLERSQGPDPELSALLDGLSTPVET